MLTRTHCLPARAGDFRFFRLLIQGEVTLESSVGLSEFFIPPAVRDDPEVARRFRLVISFGLLGTVFGALYASFYLAIGHRFGALVIIVCSLGFFLVPWIVRQSREIAPAAHFLCGVMIAGFVALCAIEGGLHGHAIAWLVSIPLCALLLAGERAAQVWCLLCVLAAGIFIGLDVSGYHVPTLYPARWESTVTGAGYLGLILFMFLLGLLFERGRERANRAMREALGKLATANQHLQELNREKSEFLGIAAHDLKNPLSVVAGYAELIHGRRIDTPEDLADCSDHILRATHQMIELITNLLDVNAIEEGKLRFDIQRCDLAEIALRVMATYRLSAEKKELSLVWERPPAPPLVRADPRATLQILDNLISNAVKYSFIGGEPISVGLVEEAEHWRVEVRDRGPGLGAEDQTHLFEKYGRLTARPTGGESSTGLGLSIVRRMAKEMGGDVACRSALGEGSTFIVLLPKWTE